MGELLLLVAGALLALIVTLHFIGKTNSVFMPLVMGMVVFFVGGVVMSFRSR
jgi:hypothetical protein